MRVEGGHVAAEEGDVSPVAAPLASPPLAWGRRLAVGANREGAPSVLVATTVHPDSSDWAPASHGDLVEDEEVVPRAHQASAPQAAGPPRA
eukprot:4036581-Alexandrium_andersonii.AAC.1